MGQGIREYEERVVDNNDDGITTDDVNGAKRHKPTDKEAYRAARNHANLTPDSEIACVND